MNKLDYSVSLRLKGLSTDEIKKKMRVKGFEEHQIQYYIKKSDEIFLNQSIHYKKSKSNDKTKKIIKITTLVLSLLLLISVFFGYAKIGLSGLFLIWGLIGYSSYRK